MTDEGKQYSFMYSPYVGWKKIKQSLDQVHKCINWGKGKNFLYNISTLL